MTNLCTNKVQSLHVFDDIFFPSNTSYYDPSISSALNLEFYEPNVDKPFHIQCFRSGISWTQFRLT